MELKKFRIRKPDGEYEIIEATSVDAALTYAKSKFGKLPNEINKSIVDSIIRVFSEVRNNLNSAETLLLEASREFDWEAIFEENKKVIEELAAACCVIQSKSGSLIKSIN